MIILKSVLKKHYEILIRQVKSERFSVSVQFLSYLKDPKTDKLRGSQVEHFYGYFDTYEEAEKEMSKLTSSKFSLINPRFYKQ